MVFRTAIHDCLRINWALAAEVLPDPPPGLRYDRPAGTGDPRVFVSALLFRQESPLPPAALTRMNVPECKLQACCTAADGTPLAWVFAVYLPHWVLPSARLVAGKLARAARFAYPELGAPGTRGDSWSWSVAAGATLDVRARPAPPEVPSEPLGGGWERTVRYFRARADVSWTRGRLRRTEIAADAPAPLPLAVDLAGTSLVPAALEAAGGEPEAAAGLHVHSAWLESRLEASFEYLAETEPAVGPGIPAVG